MCRRWPLWWALCLLLLLAGAPAEASETFASQPDWPAVQTARPTTPAAGWARATALLVPAAVLAAVGWALRGRRLQRPFLAISALSVATRALTPLVPMHIQADDLRLVATVRGIEGFTVQGFNSVHGLVLPLFRGALSLWGDNAHSAFMVAQVAGVLLAPLAVLLTWQWFRNETWPLAAGVAVLASPVAFAYSGAITAYLPAAALFSLSLILSLLARGLPVPGRAVLHAAAGGALLVAALLKPEFLLFVPAHAVLVWSQWEKRGVARLEPVLVPVVVLVLLVLFWSPYLGDFLDTSRGRGANLSRKNPGNVLIYPVLGFLCLNPPFLPLKLMFLRSFRRLEASQARWLRWFVVGFASIYFLSTQGVGFNQWRHSLAFTVPFFVALAPELWRLKEDAVAGVRRARWLLVAIVVCGLAGYGAYAIYIQGKRDLQVLSTSPLDERTLVLYVEHPRDLSPSHALAASGTAAFLPLEALWPPGSEAWSTMQRADLRIDAREVALGVDGSSVRFASVTAMDDDMSWLRNQRDSDSVAMLVDRQQKISTALASGPDEARVAGGRQRLASFERVLLFVDSESVLQARLARWSDSFDDLLSDCLHEPIELASRHLSFVDLPEGSTPALDEVRLIEVSRITGDDGRALWERR